MSNFNASKTKSQKRGKRNCVPQATSSQSSFSSSVFDVTPCEKQTCEICSGKIKPIPPSTLEKLRTDPQNYINDFLKVGELPALKSRYRKFWIHQNPTKRGGRHPDARECPWYYMFSIAKENAVLESYVRPPPIVIATHNSLAKLNNWTVRPLDYRPYAKIDQRRSKAKASPSQKLCGRFGVTLPPAVRDAVTVTSTSFQQELHNTRGYHLLLSKTLRLECLIPVRCGMSPFGIENYVFNRNTFTGTQVSLSSAIILEKKFSMKASAEVVNHPKNDGICVVKTVLELTEVRTKFIPTQRTPKEFSPIRHVLVTKSTRRYRSWKIRFKTYRRYLFSTNLANRRFTVSLGAEN